MGLFSKKEKIHTGKVGGFSFFFSLISLFILDIAAARKLIEITKYENFSWHPWRLFLIGTIATFWLTSVFVSGKLNVLIHEFKHSLFSGLVGNKSKKIVIDGSESGHFEYSFTKDTAKFNALIALAPYFIPLATFPACALLVFFHFKGIEFSQAALILGLCFGFDLFQNVRDIAPYQTDFSNLRGGFFTGLIFVILINFAYLSLFLVWIALQTDGIVLLGIGVGELLLDLFKSDS